MSRTYRRLKAKKHYSRFKSDYIDSSLTEKELVDVNWKYHTDNGMPTFPWENFFERPQRLSSKELRARMKQELCKWLKNEEHEVQFSRSPLIWDLC